MKAAVRLTQLAHEGQVRKGQARESFFNHPRRVCKDYLRFNYKTSSGAVASLCHDLVEDTPITADEIGFIFGQEVSGLVEDLTKPKEIPSAFYAKDIWDWPLEAKKIKLCDIGDNIVSSRDLANGERQRMLVKWQNYLHHLGKIIKTGLPEEEEYLQKWESVTRLCLSELEICSAPVV